MSIHRIPLMSQKIAELLSNSMTLYAAPSFASEDIVYILDEFQATPEDKKAVFNFLYEDSQKELTNVTLGEIQMMMLICNISSYTYRTR